MWGRLEILLGFISRRILPLRLPLLLSSFHALPLPRRVSVIDWAGPFPQDLPDLQVCLVQLEEKVPQECQGMKDLKANQAQEERLDPKVGGWYVAGLGERRQE